MVDPSICEGGLVPKKGRFYDHRKGREFRNLLEGFLRRLLCDYRTHRKPSHDVILALLFRAPDSSRRHHDAAMPGGVYMAAEEPTGLPEAALRARQVKERTHNTGYHPD